MVNTGTILMLEMENYVFFALAPCFEMSCHHHYFYSRIIYTLFPQECSNYIQTCSLSFQIFHLRQWNRES